MRIGLLFLFLFSCSFLHAENIISLDEPSISFAWYGAAISAGASLTGGLIGNGASSKNVKKALRAQAQENEKMREYNLMLARMQNGWNVEQWERENEYNSPEKQMERFRNAGLNPDLMAGGAQNLSAASPSMTAGAAATAQDMSALGQKPTLGQAIQTALRDSMIGAQIDNIKADTRQKNANAGITETDAKYRDAQNELGIKINERVYEKLEHEIDKAFEDAKAATYLVEKMNYEQLNQRIEYLYKEREMEAIIKKLESEAKISEQDAKLSIESYFYRFLGIKSEAELAKMHAALPSQLEQLFGENAGYAMLVLQGVQFLLGNANNFATFAGKNKHVTNHTQHIYVPKQK